SYSYTLDNSNAAVNELKDGGILTDTFSYTIQDADGDWSTTTVTITINGNTDGEPGIVADDENGAGVAGHVSVEEKGLVDGDDSQMATGEVPITELDGLASIEVGGTALDLAQLAGLSTASVTIDTPQGTLTLTGFTATTTVGGVPTAGTLAYSYELTKV